VLEVSVKKQFKGFALDVSFIAEDEKILGLLGASGCGKSLTLRCIAGIEKPDSGRIVLNGRVLFDSEKHINVRPQERRVGYLFQNYALFPNMTVSQNIAAGITDTRAEKKKIAAEWIEKMRLTGSEKKLAGQLSGGMKQRCALARAFAAKPEILLLDEPLSALDEYLRWQVENELCDAIREYGSGAVFVSHSRNEIYRVCDDVTVLSNGKSEEVKPVSELFSNPGTVAAAVISGCKNYSAAELLPDGRVYASEWGAEFTVSRITDDFHHIGVRAHYIKPHKTKVTGEAVNTISCVVTRVTQDVFSTIVTLMPKNGASDIRMEIENHSDEYAPGQEIDVFISPNDIMTLM